MEKANRAVWIVRRTGAPIVLMALMLAGCSDMGPVQSNAVDPGVRGGAAGAGGPLNGLAADETTFFNDGLTRFAEVNTVTGADHSGLGPRFNSNQCLGCHLQPGPAATSPASNPRIAVAPLNGAKNVVPWFITAAGPIREARFKQHPDGTADGNVHDLFVITGRSDAGGCNIAQESFLPAGDPVTGQGGNPNIIYRIPTPTFGTGLIEAIPDSAILANMNSNRFEKSAMGISGHPNSILSGNVNRSGNDGTITRFGWKAQNKSLRMFAGEAYNVESGVTNQLFPHMGSGLADGITPGAAGPDEFRTAPLWGVGQRIFFLHDGRTKDLVQAIGAHRSPGSEASRVVRRYERLPTQQQQDLVNFLRSL